MRILLVEDDADLAAAILRALRAENFAVDHATNGEDGAHLGDTGQYDAAVLDLGLPIKSGIAVLNEWRAAGRTLPVLILTARDGWSGSCRTKNRRAPEAARRGRRHRAARRDRSGRVRRRATAWCGRRAECSPTHRLSFV